jgi:hypothetical protein
MTALDDARAYLGASYGPQYTAWLALGDSDAGKTLVSATRHLNEQPWQGTATGILDGNPTTLAWPRSGVIIDGVEISSLTIPDAITQATFELAVMILADPDIVSAPDTSTNVKAVMAGGGVGVEFFVPTSTRDGSATRLPTMIQRLVGKYLGSPSAVDGGYSRGGNACSEFSDRHAFKRSWPF